MEVVEMEPTPIDSYSTMMKEDVMIENDKVRMAEFVFEDGFIRKVRYDIENPRIHYKINKPEEVCGSFRTECIDEKNHRYVIRHDMDSSFAKSRNEHGFQKGSYDPEDNIQFCHPKKYSTNIIWHTHPVNVPAYPSGSDVFVTMINDCTPGLDHSETAAQAYVEFLFTEHGFWLIHRHVNERGEMASAIDLTGTDGKPIRLNYHQMVDVESVRSHVETLMSVLESKIMSNYYRTRVPDRQAVEMINNEINNNPIFHMIKRRVKLNFFPWDSMAETGGKIYLPTVLIDTPVTNVCLRH